MEQFGNLYSQYYDLLYGDKDYHGEVQYVDNLIKKNTSNAISILDMGCGTGIHAHLFYDLGYIVHGIDMSEDMLKIARKKINGKEERLRFTQSNIQELNLNKKFDVVISLFHVMSYQNSNDELIKSFEVAKSHLNDGGIFIFDFWYGPAVLTNLPTNKKKHLENDDIKVTRITESILYPQQNITEVNFDVLIEDKITNEKVEKKEIHNMRYFFDKELELISDKTGFKINEKYEWMTHKAPDFNSWNVVWVLKI